MCRWLTKATPFALAYGMKAIIPTEIGMSTTKRVVQGQRNDNEELEKQLDWEDEVKGNAAIQMTSYRQRAIAHYNKKARARVFRTEALVPRKVFENTTEAGPKKF